MDESVNSENASFSNVNKSIDERKSTFLEKALSLDSNEEETIIIDKFRIYLNQALEVDNLDNADPSEVLLKLEEIRKQALDEFENLSNLNFSKFIKSIITGSFSLNFNEPKKSDLRYELKEQIRENYLDTINRLCRRARGVELLIKRNWEKHSRGNQKMREEWLNNWLNNLISQHRGDESIKNYLDLIVIFADKKINVTEHNGKKIVFLDWDREFVKKGSETTIHPALEFLIASPDVDSVMVEYFAPELKANFRGENLPDNLKENPLIKKILLLLKKYTLQYVDGTKPTKAEAYKRRLFGFDSINQLCIKHNKDVLVGDIADSYQYMIARDAAEELLKPILTLGFLSGFPNLLRTNEHLHALKNFVFPLSSFGLMLFHLYYNSSIIKRGTLALEPNLIDKLNLHLEDARRLFLAKAIDKATKNSKENSEQKFKSMLVIYPPHHNNRIIDYLNNLWNPKQIFYKTVYPYLNYSLRHYSKDKATKNETSKIYSGWSLTEKIPLN